MEKETINICEQELLSRIDRIETILESAKVCLQDENYHQCAVRIQCIGDESKFSGFDMDIFDSISDPGEGD